MEVEIARVLDRVLNDAANLGPGNKYIDTNIVATNMLAATGATITPLLSGLIAGPDDVGDFMGQRVDINRLEWRAKFYLGPTSGPFSAAPSSVVRVWMLQSDSDYTTGILSTPGDVRCTLALSVRPSVTVIFKKLYLVSSCTAVALGGDTQYWALTHDELFVWASLFKKVQLGTVIVATNPVTRIESGHLYYVYLSYIGDVKHSASIRVDYADKD